MLKPAVSKINAAFIAPCIGIGGADGLMTSLIRHAYNINWVGAAITSRLTKEMAEWASLSWDPRVPIHSVEHDLQYDGIVYHETNAEAIYEACKDAQIIITWCYKNLPHEVRTLNIPIIEYAQNTDLFASDVVTSNDSCVNYRAACSVAASKVFGPEGAHVIYNGIDPSRCTPRTGRELQRKVWGIPDDKKVILFMGRFVQEKHPEDLIRALTELDDEYIGLYCGAGTIQQEIYDLAQRMVPGRVCFIDGQYHVGDVLAASDCFLLSSDFEGHPLALMEAMLAGIPCVYSDLEVMEELHGFLGPMGTMVKRGCSSEELAGGILAALSDQQMLVTNHARMCVWENFTISRIAHQWEEYIEHCVQDWWRKRRLTTIHPVPRAKPMTKPRVYERTNR